MQAYEGSINQGEAQNSYLVLSTEDNEFFRMFGQGALTDELREAELGPRRTNEAQAPAGE